MSFVEAFKQLPLQAWRKAWTGVSPERVRRALAAPRPGLEDFLALLSPAAGDQLEELGRVSRQRTLQRFGKVVRLFAPLYLSNECINNCAYCGFSRDNPIVRVTLSPEEVLREARSLKRRGFRHLLLVAGEHPKFIPADYLEACVSRVAVEIPSVSLEIGPMETPAYERLVRAGAEGLVVYQETYNREAYQALHTAGPKRDFDWRLATPERAYAAGFRRLGLGALFGLSEWRMEAMALAAHVEHLLRRCWKAQLTVSLPRLRPCAGEFQPRTLFSDRDLAQVLCALRIVFPDVGLVLSTREPARLRDGLIPLGVTLLSAGSHTEPGGYTGAGQESLHLTEKGRIRPAPGLPERATGQFEIADHRSPEEMAAALQRLGYEAVWKDWEILLHA